MAKVVKKMISVEGATAKKHLFNHSSNPQLHIFNCKRSLRCVQTVEFQSTKVAITGYKCFPVYQKLPKMAEHNKHQVKVCAIRKRRSNIQTDTYVLLEPGKSEEFVSEEELKARLTYWLENWPGNSLPPDLARYKTIDHAVLHLVKSVCELEIDGDVGSIQWYEVRLE